MTGIKALRPLVGEWATTIEMIFPPEIAGQTFAAKDTYRWAPGGQFLIHDVDAQMGDETILSFDLRRRGRRLLIPQLRPSWRDQRLPRQPR